MDPLSIIVSSLALIGAIAATTKQLKNIRDTNEDVQRLIDDLTDFGILLQQTKSLLDINHASIPQDQLADLSVLLERANGKISELEALYQKVLKKGADSKSRASKFAWTRCNPQIVTLQTSLQSNKQSLSLLLTCMTMSCTLRLFDTMDELSRNNAKIDERQTLVQKNISRNVKMQSMSQKRILGKLTEIDLSNNRLHAVYPLLGQWDQNKQARCKRCEFVQAKGIAPACLYCARLSTSTTRMVEPALQFHLLEKRALNQDPLLSQEYQYLEEILVSWTSDKISVFVKAHPYPSCSNLEVHAKKFHPSWLWVSHVAGRTFDDRKGWVSLSPVMTMPYAIPYTHYVESGRLRMWARESFRWKLCRRRHVPGRSLLSTVGLSDASVIQQHKLFQDAFTFAALSWLSMSLLHASNRPTQESYDTNLSPPRLAEDERDGIFMCPSAINSQLCLLCHESARQLETEVLSGIDKLVFEVRGARSNPSLEIAFILYTAFTLLMDAYECFAIIFEEYPGHELERCLHLVECIAAELRNLLRGLSMREFLAQAHSNQIQIPGSVSEFAKKVLVSAEEEDTRAFFEKYSWTAAKASNYTELNFAFQSLLQGY